MVLFFSRLYGLRAEEAAGVSGRGGAALRREGRLRQTASWATGVEAHLIRWGGGCDPLKAGVGGRRLRLVQRISAQ